MGDLNARVGSMLDYINNDEFDDYVPVDDEYITDRAPRKRQKHVT